MINRFRKRFVLMVMVSLVIMTVINNTAINIVNGLNYIKVADDSTQLLLSSIQEEEKKDKPDKKEEPHNRERPEQKRGENYKEKLRSARYFTVKTDKNGEITEIDLDNVVITQDQEAKEYTKEALSTNKETGQTGIYRFRSVDTQDGKIILFVDFYNQLSSLRSFFFISWSICIASLLVVFAVCVYLSERVVRPFVEVREKQRRFISDAGHEIKTPITIINADIEVLKTETGENEWIEDITRQTRRLAELTDDLVFLSKTEEEPNIALSGVDLSKIALETLESFKSMEKLKGLKIETNIEEQIEILGDARSIKRLFTVLFDNAVKYAPEGDTVTFILKKQGKNSFIEIENTATELEKGDIPNLFDRFYRGKKSRGERVKGHGLGLSVAKAVTNLHKGKITASLSKQRFKITVVLPL